MRARFGAAFVAAFTGFLIVSSGGSAFTQPPGGKGKDGKGGFGPPRRPNSQAGQGLRQERRRLAEQGRARPRSRIGQERRFGGKGFGGKGFGGKGGFGKGVEPVSTGAKGLARRGGSLSERKAVRLRDPAHHLPRLREPAIGKPSFRTSMAPMWTCPRRSPWTGRSTRTSAFTSAGMSSYMGVPTGSKRSLNVSLDMADKKQRLDGYKTLNLLNSHEDPSMMSTVLYSHIARQYIPAPKANFVKVVINGESWGVYASVQQFDKVFLKENYKTGRGHPVEGPRQSRRPRRAGVLGRERRGLQAHLRDEGERRREAAWKALINLCKVLNETPPDKLEAALRPICDMDGLLWFLALDVALINNDGYWIRSSDYSLYLDKAGKFHFIPHDMNEAFRPAGGPGLGGGMFMRLPPPGEVLPLPLQDMLQLTDLQKKQLAELQKEVDARLDKLLTEEQRKQFKEMRERGPGGFGPRRLSGHASGWTARRLPGGPGGPRRAARRSWVAADAE